MLKKSLVSLISLMMLLSLFLGFGGNKASANTAEETLVLDSVPFDSLVDNPGSIITDQVNPGDIQVYSLPSKAVKESLKWAVNNTTDITNYIGRYFGKDAAVAAGNVMHNYVKPVLKKLDNAHDLTYGKVETELRKALEQPLGDGTARIVASVIVQAIEFLAPI